MERWLQILLIILLFTGCSEENACIKNAGEPIIYSIESGSFNEIEINDGIEVELIHSPDTLIKIHTRANLKPFILSNVHDKKLVLKDENSCNWLRDFNQTKIQIYHPGIVKISHLGSNRVYSTDTLYYPNLTLFSARATGDFDLILNNNKVSISINDLSNVILSGKTNELFAGIASGDGRIDAEHLQAKKAGFFHRGTNDLLVYPENILEGKILSTGNVIYYNIPPEISVEDNGSGSLISR